MKTTLITSVLILSSIICGAQAHRATSGNAMDGNITDITPCDTPGFILTRMQPVDIDFDITWMNWDNVTNDGFFVTVDGAGSTTDYGITISNIQPITVSFSELPYHGSFHLDGIYVGTGHHTLNICHSRVLTLASKAVIVREATKTANIPAGSPINIYPIPAADMIHISVPTDVRVQKISLTDAAGRKIKTIDTRSATDLQLPVNDVAPGMYCLMLQTDDNVLVKQVMVRR